MSRWQFWIDRGGTFTDVIGISPSKSLHVEKILSECADASNLPAVVAIKKILNIRPDEKIPAELIDIIKIGTTVATNALLERKGEPTLLVTNRGFGDVLKIAYQNRPDIFAKKIVLPAPLYSRVLEIDCRYNTAGEELQAVDQNKIEQDLMRFYNDGLRACAILFIHGYKFDSHEKLVAALAKSIGFEQISTSHECSRLPKMVGRGDTCVADAYLSPVLRSYVEKLRKELPAIKLLFMQSNGGLVAADRFRGKDSLLSGPAGGVVGAVHSGEKLQIRKIIAFDMGGTSTDVAHYDNNYEHTNDVTIAGIRIRTPMLAVHTVAAGGGSVCSFENGRFKVGPESAGAIPGPASYGRGGPLTITDCNLVLGRIQPYFFPKIFGKQSEESLDVNAVVRQLTDLSEQIQTELRITMTAEAIASGFLDIAIERMASAIKQISIERGHDLSSYTLVSFGGAAGQHACAISAHLGINNILIHPLAGVLSAMGIGMSSIKSVQQMSIEKNLDQTLLADLNNSFSSLQRLCIDHLKQQQSIIEEEVAFQNLLNLKYEGTDFCLPILYADFDSTLREFDKQHLNRFQFLMKEKALIVESIITKASTQVDPIDFELDRSDGICESDRNARLYINGSWTDVPLKLRKELKPGQSLSGPAILIDDTSTTIIESSWNGTVSEDMTVILTRSLTQPLTQEAQKAQDVSAFETELSASNIEENCNRVKKVEPVDPALLALFNHSFMAIAEQMGAALQSTSYSVNIKERLDFSCAIFDRTGALIANAPHIPVHLGSMSDCVKAIINANGAMKEGDAYATNNPYRGGTHLPDITVISPVFIEPDNLTEDSDFPPSRSADFYVASRGHHADIGGISPGSMPANSRDLKEEGIVIDNFKLVSNGVFAEKEMVDLLSAGPYPARNVSQNISDLKAQIAANVKGEKGLKQLVRERGLGKTIQYMQHIQENSEGAVQKTLARLPVGSFECTMDDGAKICVQIRRDDTNGKTVIDFNNTSAQQPNNMNAPKAISKAAIMYVLRTLIDEDIPLSDGFLKPIEMIVPEHCLLNPDFPAAIVAGNVETSQQITDALYGAFGAMAASQGTMNNLTFGNEWYQYYETIAGGSGAGPCFDGASAVQTNMTNSRLTDPEVLENRFPVLLERFLIRSNSGGDGEYRGGDGALRQIKFLEAMTVSILSQRRSVSPHGLCGGEPGARGANYVLRRDGTRTELSSNDLTQVQPGDSVVIETPGGGGYGTPKPR